MQVREFTRRQDQKTLAETNPEADDSKPLLLDPTTARLCYFQNQQGSRLAAPADLLSAGDFDCVKEGEDSRQWGQLGTGESWEREGWVANFLLGSWNRLDAWMVTISFMITKPSHNALETTEKAQTCLYI